MNIWCLTYGEPLVTLLPATSYLYLLPQLVGEEGWESQYPLFCHFQIDHYKKKGLIDKQLISGFPI